MLKRWLLHWLAGFLAVWIAVWLAKRVGLPLGWPSVWRMVVFVPVLGCVNSVIGPFLRLISLPITCLTFGLFGFVVNALIFWLAGAATGAVMNFWSALFGSVIVTITGGVISRLIKEIS
ncbi:MAG: phage holin family protein [Armatimonadota bacterium]|nr:phage holin family protein [Armatimonadota bacterium]